MRSELRGELPVSEAAQAAFCMLPQSKKVVEALPLTSDQGCLQMERHEALFQLEDFFAHRRPPDLPSFPELSQTTVFHKTPPLESPWVIL